MGHCSLIPFRQQGMSVEPVGATNWNLLEPTSDHKLVYIPVGILVDFWSYAK